MGYNKALIHKFKIRRLQAIYILYWLLLSYILAALVFWFMALNRQNVQLSKYRLDMIDVDDESHEEKQHIIEISKDSKTAQYIGEGIAFLLLIITGAVFVFRAINRQFTLSQQQQNFMMAITHELKTPIAITKLNLETLLKRNLNEEQRQKLINITIQEANRLNALCNNMLLTSQIELGGYNIVMEKIDFARLVKECVHDFVIRFPQRTIETRLPPEAYITGDLLLLTLAVNNLLDNAIKYSGKEDIVLLKMLHTARGVQLQVIDEGPGIPPADKEKIFEKYYRGNMRQQKGTGLGLYLTRKIVQEHKGSIRMTDNNPRGSIFTITLNGQKNLLTSN
jgi:two-component system, OmpR family, sensor histidine kinase CiaH